MPRFRRRTLPVWPLLSCLVPTAFAQAPVEAWIHAWNGPNSVTDEAVQGVADPDGRLFVTGTSYHAVAIDSREDFFLNRLDDQGQLVWSRLWGGAQYDAPSALAITPDGDIAVVGISGSPRRIATLVYDIDGNLLWEALRPVTGLYYTDFPPRLAVGADGSLTVIGSDQDRIVALRYSSAGAPLWDELLPDLGSEGTLPGDVAVAPDGSAYVAGLVYGLATGGNADVLFKLDAAGQFAWQELETGNFGGFFEFVGVEVGPDGNPLVVGNPESNCGLFEERIWKLDAATGGRLWTNLISTEPCDVVVPSDFILDVDGNALVASSGRTEGSSDRMQTTKWSPDGDLLWYREYEAAGSFGGSAAAIAVDGSGAAYVTGLSIFGSQDRDWTTLKYDADGALQWDLHWGAAFGGNDWAQDVAITPGGDVVVFGLGWNGLPTYSDATTIFYDQPGPSAVAPSSPATGQSVRALVNPFSGSTRIRYALGRDSSFTLTVFDVRGRLVRRLQDGVAASGPHEIGWDGRDDGGRELPSGVYLLRLETARGASTQRVGLVR